MNISSVNMSGAISVASITATVPVNVMGSSHSAHAAGGDVSSAQVKQMAADMQGQIDSMNVSLQFSLYGENDNKIAVKVVNKDTGNVIREIPAKEMQALQSKMSELVGMIFNENG